MPLTTRTVAVDPEHPDPAALDEAASILRRGGLVVFPTETVYGLGADATSATAVAGIFAAKGRPSTNPLIVHADSSEAVRSAVSAWPAAAATLADRFWPGPLTLVLPRSAAIPDAVTGGLDTVGVRVPDHPVARALLRRAGIPVAAPSANRSTRVSPTRADHARKDLDGRVDLILDAGPTHVGIESTVLDLTCDPPRVLRPGAVTVEQLSRVLGRPVLTPAGVVGTEGTPFTSPGQMEVHYAPRARVVPVTPGELGGVSAEDGPRALIIAGHEVRAVSGDYAHRVDWRDPSEAARVLYATFHAWDDEGVKRIDVVLPPESDDAWRAVRDRLWRASRRWARAGLNEPDGDL